jgi:pyruvate formate lyase activating enzyme
MEPHFYPDIFLTYAPVSDISDISMGTSRGLIFDVKRFAVHDGPGIRTTVFFKGCPLRCVWCHNPEGLSAAPEIMVFAGRCLRGCRDCLAKCPRGALAKRGGSIVLDRVRCDGCGSCVKACPADALQRAGRELSPGELVDEIARDLPFFEKSGGGATFSGGEPLQQAGFLSDLLSACRRLGIRTAVDTAGLAPWETLAGLLPLADLFLFDLKLIDDGRHRRFTGVSNRAILENLDRLSRSGAELAVRIPLIPGVNDAPRDLDALAAHCAALGRRHPVHVLPYHRGYMGKLKRLGLENDLPATAPPAARLLERARQAFSRRGLGVIIGG